VVTLLGRETEARELYARAGELTKRVKRGRDRIAQTSTVVGLLELSLGHLGEAASIYRRLTAADWNQRLMIAGGRVAVDTVEALSAVGDIDRAWVVARTMPPDARERSVVQAQLTAGEGDLDRAIELLLTAPPTEAPYPRAREMLLLGTLQRRLRRRRDARETLNAARAEFERLGARLWLDRTDEQLARIGGRAPSGNVLTESERRVAELVAAGLSNKEVAAALVISVHTVEAHLRNIYAKLGIHSRAALAGQLATDVAIPT
jgi:ATP/maltotriose-dependent transcriptional regulator MalT